MPYHQPYCPSVVGKDWVQEPLKPTTAFFLFCCFVLLCFVLFCFPMGFGVSPTRDVILLPSPPAASPSTTLPWLLLCYFGALLIIKKNILLFPITCHRQAYDMPRPVEMSHHSRDSTGRHPVLPILGFVDCGNHQGGITSSEHYTSIRTCCSWGRRPVGKLRHGERGLISLRSHGGGSLSKFMPNRFQAGN